MAVLYKIEEKTILFIHIPKTGGGSVDTALSKYRVNEPRIVGHPTLEQCLKVVNPDHIFTVIRNPWDWRSSWFHYLKEGKSGQTYEYNNCKDKSFKDHLKWIDSEPRQNFTNSHYNGTDSKLFITPQSEYINDNVKVLRFENLKGDFEDYMSDMGLDIKLNKHIHKSTNNNYVKEYDSETIKIVERQLKSDVLKFGYNFKMTKLSILLCAHCPNASYDDLLVKAISSIYEQSYKDYKLFIVLDECWGMTLSKVKDVITPDTEIIIRNKKDGLARAKNAGLERINTEYVAFLDADDEYLPGKLEKQMNFIENNNVDFLGTLATIKDVRKGIPKFFPSCISVGEYETHEQICNIIGQGNVMTHGSMLIRKKALDELGGYNDVRGKEDWDLWKRAISSGYKFHQLQERLYMLTMGTSVER